MKNVLLILALVLVAFGLYVQFGAPDFAAAWPAWYAWVAMGVGVVIGLYAFMNKKA
ncbi:hypothetical protein [Brevundimonas sp.]|uniref:hypothetical protein n=1 Tax=Brevundimonas sp. TaxID=1871086 RepID=UPI0025ED7767|nr:hypothetical protein [Brevundimonas sp.]